MPPTSIVGCGTGCTTADHLGRPRAAERQAAESQQHRVHLHAAVGTVGIVVTDIRDGCDRHWRGACDHEPANRFDALEIHIPPAQLLLLWHHATPVRNVGMLPPNAAEIIGTKHTASVFDGICVHCVQLEVLGPE